MLNLIPVLLLLLMVVVLVWPTRMGAQLVGAVQNSWLMAALAILGGLMLSAVLAIGVGFVYAIALKAPPPEALLGLLAVVATAFAYSKILETTLFGGITIYLIQVVCTVLFGGLVYLGLSAWMPEMVEAGDISGVSDIRTAGLREASDSVCGCGTDQDCLSRNYRELRKIAADFENAYLLPAERTKAEEYTRRAKLCVMQPAAAAETADPAAPAATPVP